MGNQEYLKLLEKEGIAIEETLARFMDNQELFIRFLRKFFSETDLNELKRSLADENFEESISISHSLKGVSANLGVRHLYEQLSQVVAALKEDDIEAAKFHYLKVELEFERLKNVV